MRATLLSVLAVLATAAPGLSQGEERRVPGYLEAVDALVAAVKGAAPEGVSVELNEAVPSDLGWRAADGTPARALVIMAPSGAARVFGLLPREGTYAPDPDGRPQFVAAGPALLVVGASQLLQVALTLEELQAAKPALDRACAPITALAEAPEAPLDASAFVKGEVARAVKREHHVEVDVKAGGTIDVAAAHRAGHAVVVHRVLSKDGSFVPPTISIAAR